MLSRVSNILHPVRMVCIFVLCCVLSACHWQEARQVIALADSLDQTEHVIYDDTAALGRTIRCLDNPVGRLLMSNTLGKAYYFMGRNYSLSDQIVEAAECYIEADRLQIDDPIYRGRINSCMGYICAQNNSDSLALIFYERAHEDFVESGNEWRYAQSLLNVSLQTIELHQFNKADSILRIAQTYHLDSAYQARCYETCGLYFYEQQQYDSALIYFNIGLNYWKNEEEKSFTYLKIMQVYLEVNKLAQAIPHALRIIQQSNNPNYLINAYYCLMQDAKNENNTELLSIYSHARTDAQRLLLNHANNAAEANPKLEEYLSDPHPLRWVWIMLGLVIVICIILAIGAAVYRQCNRIACEQIDQLSTHIENQEARLTQELVYRQFHEKLSDIVNKYHTPHKRWRNYSVLKKDLAPWLHDWTTQLDALPLSEQDKIFCTISLIYPNLSDVEIADYMCYTKGSIRVLKNRILKKIGVSSSEFSKFLHNLSNCK